MTRQRCTVIQTVPLDPTAIASALDSANRWARRRNRSSFLNSDTDTAAVIPACSPPSLAALEPYGEPADADVDLITECSPVASLREALDLVSPVRQLAAAIDLCVVGLAHGPADAGRCEDTHSLHLLYRTSPEHNEVRFGHAFPQTSLRLHIARGQTPAWPLERRIALLTRSFDLLGVRDAVRITQDRRPDFESASTWRFEYDPPGGGQTVTGPLDRGFAYFNLPSLDDATDLAERWVSAMIHRVTAQIVTLSFSPPAYELAAPLLAALRRCWRVLPMGRLRAGVDVRRPRPGDWIPAIGWSRNTKHAGEVGEEYSLLAVTHTRGGVRLEVRSERRDQAAILRDAEAATDLTFEIVDVCGE